MGEPYNVKARVHHGSESLDLTIPAELRRELGITPGDLFIVEAEEDESGSLVVEYERVHEAGPSE
jgi:AbrB family looped-hinge helix DNA binding protein